MDEIQRGKPMTDQPLETPRLLLLPAHEGLADAVADYYRRNRDFLAATEPQHPPEFYTSQGQRPLLAADACRAQRREGYRFFIAQREQPGRVIGSVALSNIVWGAFLSCFLGYKLDGELLSRGYMTEAVGRAVAFAFDELGLHRIEANIMPRNAPSLRVAEKLGFQYEGISPRYLRIGGKWEDHVHMVRLNPNPGFD
jgi:ribosomal-protein-alanine N-acetyltransferase